ncbi:hypothetical protein WJX74_010809 [Apatococcus lobatus]|uniref:S-adenosyl-L-methionine-dependent methyltransferase n=1 Tax=Apatococcus lobatus TaxID=904363 RepID=A0AAW1RZN8_9CHLO
MPPLNFTRLQLLGFVGTYVGVVGAAYIYVRRRDPPQSKEAEGGGTGSAETFDQLADSYDSRLGWDEAVMGLKLLRWWVIRQAKGDVLEISAGTGRNVPYYNAGAISSLTFTDKSKYMLWHAKQKYDAQLRLKAEKAGVPVSFALSDAEHLCGSSQLAAEASGAVDGPGFGKEGHTFPAHSFDTVIDTFGLCSHEDPAAALQEAARACRPGGQIYLLEHGRASYDWLNKILDESAAGHHYRWGCWWNRDITELVSKAGLEIVSMQRWHFGTTYQIVARPAATAADGQDNTQA